MSAWLMLLLATTLLAFGLHRLLSVIPAATVAALIITVAYQIAARIQSGYLDKFWPIAAGVSFLVCSVVAIAALAAWKLLRRNF